MDDDLFHVGVDLLLKRMESNPDDFISGGNMWHLVEHNKRWFTKEEKDAIGKKMTEIHMAKFHKELMAKILKSDERPVAVESNFGAAQVKQSGTTLSYGSNTTASIIASGLQNVEFGWTNPSGYKAIFEP